MLFREVKSPPRPTKKEWPEYDTTLRLIVRLHFIYNRVVARKIRLTRNFVYFVYWINKINTRMKYLAGWRGRGLFDDERMLWSGRTVLSGDALGAASNSTGVWPLLDLFMCSRFQTPAPENTTCGKMIGWKISFFYITENFPWILDRLCTEPMHRNHDFLSLTLAVVGSTSGICCFLLQCRCLWVCVLYVSVVWCVKS